jgi:hypothetical protein
MTDDIYEMLQVLSIKTQRLVAARERDLSARRLKHSCAT